MNELLEKGGHALRIGDLETAEILFSFAISKYPNHAITYLLRAKTYQEQGKLHLALADIEKAYDLEPNNNEISVLKGRIKEMIHMTEAFLNTDFPDE